MIKITHFGFLAAKGFERSLIFQILTYWSYEHVYNRFLREILTSLTEDEWTCWEAIILSGILASKKCKYPLSVTYAIWDGVLMFQQALSTDSFWAVLWTILSPGNRESNMEIVLSSEQVKRIETSAWFHSTLLILAVWWSDVKMFVCLEMSQILRVESAEPDAKTPKLDAFNDRLITESVWLPCLNFLLPFENFLGFLLLLINSPPKVISGSTASKTSKFQN